MSTALLILSPLETAPLQTQTAAELAITLKDQGIRQVDLTADSHYSVGAAHGNYAVTPFTSAARNVSDVMGSVIGRTRMYDLPAALDRSIEPAAATFYQIARSCLLQSLGADHTRRDLRDLAFVFYATVHAGQYERLVFPHMSRRAQNALFVLAHNLRDKETRMYGYPIRLDRIRNLVFSESKINTAPKGVAIN